MPNEEQRPAIGRSLNRYELLHELGSGGMATVYLGRARGAAGFERLVAIKCCHPHLRRNPAFLAQFLDEARLAARIRHPNVVATFDVSDAESLHLVMEYIEGGTLAQTLDRAAQAGVPVSVGIATRIVADALLGLHAAHEQRDEHGRLLHLVHRDVSPQNILIGFDGLARIADFGIAKAESRLAVTDEGRIKGKLGYMAPEMLCGEEVTRQTDVYAAGVVLWEALAGRRLLRAQSHAEAVELALRADVPPPSTSNPDVPSALDAVVLRALAREPGARFATAAQMAEACEAAVSRLPTALAVGRFMHEVFGDGPRPFAAERPPTPVRGPVTPTEGTSTDVVPSTADTEPAAASSPPGATATRPPERPRALRRLAALGLGASVALAALLARHAMTPATATPSATVAAAPPPAVVAESTAAPPRAVVAESTAAPPPAVANQPAPPTATAQPAAPAGPAFSPVANVRESSHPARASLATAPPRARHRRPSAHGTAVRSTEPVAARGATTPIASAHGRGEYHPDGI